MSTSLAISRVPTALRNSLLAGTLNDQQSSLIKVEQQLSTGQRLNLGSDDPAATVDIQLTKYQQAANTQYTNNLDFASSFLGTADSTLNSLGTLITSASTTANAAVGSTTSADQRTAYASTIDSLLSQSLSLANTRYQGASVFGGANGVSDAFASVNGGYKFQGSTQQQGITTADGGILNYTVDGSQIFGGASAQVTGTPLSPALTANTKLSDVTGATGSGISAGAVTLTYGATSVNVDLSQAATVGDVTALLNQAFTANSIPATASTAGGSFTIANASTTAGLTIANASNSAAASTLGITGTAATSSTLTGTSVSPKVTALTPLSALNNGAGLDTSGLIISNGSKTDTISLAGLTTVQDLLNAINSSGTQAQAAINSNGTGINVLNDVSGVPLTIGENGGQTATQLGIRSFAGSTQLSVLNNGAGVTPISQTATGQTGNIVITKTDGSTFTVKTDGITTSSQLIAAINSATGNSTVTASLNPTGNAITLTDTTGGGGNLAVSQGSNYVSNGTDFGLFSTGAGGTLTGKTPTFSTDDFRISRADGSSFTVNLTGANTIQDVLNKINNADGNTAAANKVTASLAATGNGIVLTDASTGSATLSVAATNSSSVLQQLGLTTSAAGNSITGTDTNPIQTQGIFSSLVQLRNALAANDTKGIQQAATLLANDKKRVSSGQGVIGAREKDISARKTYAQDLNTQLTTTLSTLQDTDFTTAATQLQSLQTAYNATLQIFQTDKNLSLLDFLK